MLVGALPDAVFATREIHLTAGQTLLLYTDGLTEARVDDELFGEQRLLAFLADHAGEGARKVVAGVRRLIEGFTSPPTDDVALLALSAGGASRGPG
jgi:sigma-B regulation protein RsbU (phosphoserine phosphatase)